MIVVAITKGLSPLYRDGTGWPASLPYIWKIRVSVAIGTQSGIRLHERVPQSLRHRNGSALHQYIFIYVSIYQNNARAH